MPAKVSSTSFARGGTLGATVVMVLLLVPDTLFAYPVFGTKRYGRSNSALNHHRVSSSWAVPAPLPMQPYQQPQPRAAQTHYGLAAPAYYADPIISYPYAQEYPPEADYIYAPQEPLYNAYPYFGGVPKYSTYQNVLPYYYTDGRHDYGYYNYDELNDPVDDLQEEIQQEEEREEREEALPIGQETWFEGQQPPHHDSIDDVNAAFLQNLIISHIYNDRLRNPAYFGAGPAYTDFDYGTDGWFYDTPVSTGERGGYPNADYYQTSDEEIDDEDVRELKSLVKKNRSGEIGDHETTNDRFSQTQQDWYSPPAHQYYEPTWFVSDAATPWYQGGWGNAPYFKRNYNDKKAVTKKQESSKYGPWIPSAKSAINFSDRKGNVPVVARLAKTVQQPTLPSVASTTSSTTTTTPKPSTTTAPDFDPRRGQKEVALLRPPTPIRHPFKSPAIERLMTTRSGPNEHHGPSVYETIKQLLNMENKLHRGTDSDVQLQQHPRPQKRFVNNEESLVEELSGLKKVAA